MRRDLDALEDSRFDVLVVGGGILGASVARDAALRGFRVALVERADFAGSTSANSLKVVHGGLRYLQRANLRRLRASIRERSIWLRIAPHLVHPLPVLVPTFGYGTRNGALLHLAAAIHDAFGWDRNDGLHEERALPAGRLLSPAECRKIVPEFDASRFSGGILYYDAQMYSSERLVLEVVRSAYDAGAVVANYVECVAADRHNARESCVTMRDRLKNQTFRVQARMIVNAAGASTPAVARMLQAASHRSTVKHSVAMNLVLPGLGHGAAFGVSPYNRGTRSGGRELFFVPWRNRTIVGTAHYSFHGEADTFEITEAHVNSFLKEVNDALPPTRFSPSDIALVHAGLLPTSPSSNGGNTARLLRRPVIIDHARYGRPGVISAMTVKYTTARLVAERVVDLVVDHLVTTQTPCLTAERPLPGSPPVALADLLAEARRDIGSLVDDDVVEHLVRSYGASYKDVVAYKHTMGDWSRRVIPDAPVIKAQFAYGVEREMAVRPDDLVHRRTELGPCGFPTDVPLSVAADALSAAGVGVSPTPYPVPGCG